MSYEEEFDRLMREKAGEMHYPFEEAHWQKASEMIRRSRGGALRIRALLLGGAIVAGLGISALIYTSSDKSERTEVALATPSEQAVQPGPQDAGTRTAEMPSVSEPGVLNTANELNSGAGSDIAKDLPAAAPAVEKTAARSRASVQAAARQAALPSEELPLEEASTPVPSATGEGAGSAASLSPAQAVTLGPDPLPSADPAKEARQEPLAAEETTTGETTGIEQMMGRWMQLAYSSPDPEAILRPMSEVKMKDDDYYKKDKKPLVYYADVMGGGSYNAGWENRGKQDGKGLNWYGGVNAGLFVCRRLSIGSGFQAFNLGNITQPFHVARATDYDFASATSKTVMTCSQLQYFGVPLKLTWHGKTGELSVGIIGAQLWRADNTLESTVVRDNSVIASETSSNHNLYEGMTQQLLLLNVGYSVRVRQRLFIGAEVIYGMTDIYSGSSYYASGREVPATFRVGITYRLMER